MYTEVFFIRKLSIENYGKHLKLSGKCFRKHIESCKHNPNQTNQEKNRLIQYDLNHAFVISDDEDKLSVDYKQKLTLDEANEICISFASTGCLNKLDHGDIVMAAILDFLKAFEYVDPDLLLRKLFHYSFNNNALSLLRNYFAGRSQQTRLGTCFSDFAELHLGVPQWSILNPLLILIFINDLSFYCITVELPNILFAGDMTPYIVGSDITH